MILTVLGIRKDDAIAALLHERVCFRVEPSAISQETGTHAPLSALDLPLHQLRKMQTHYIFRAVRPISADRAHRGQLSETRTA